VLARGGGGKAWCGRGGGGALARWLLPASTMLPPVMAGGAQYTAQGCLLPAQTRDWWGRLEIQHKGVRTNAVRTTSVAPPLRAATGGVGRQVCFQRPQLVGNTQPQGWGRRARAGAARRGLGGAGWTQRAGGGRCLPAPGWPFASSWRTLKCGAPVLLRGNTLWGTCRRVWQSGAASAPPNGFLFGGHVCGYATPFKRPTFYRN
jgi:hypothetical protein